MGIRTLQAAALVAALLAAGALEATADRLRLKGGGSIEGEVEKTDAGYRVRLPNGGLVVVPLAEVEDVDPGPTARERYEARLGEIERTDADGYYRLGLYCLEHGLGKEAETCFRRAIQIVPDHEAAHAALGEVFFEGRWMSLEEALARAGQVKHGQKWVTPEERDRLLLEERRRKWSAEIRKLSLRARSTDPKIRAEGIRALGAIDDPAALRALTEYAEHWHPDVRAAVFPSLARFPYDEGAIERLAGAATRDEALAVQDAAIAVIASARLEAAADRLLEVYVNSEEAWCRKAAAHALGKIRYKRAFDPLVRTLYFKVLKHELVPTDGPGFLVGTLPRRDSVGDPFGRRRLLLRSYTFQSHEYRVVADIAYNDAARMALKALTGKDFDFDRAAWLNYWDQSSPGFDDWMGPRDPAQPQAPAPAAPPGAPGLPRTAD